MSAIERGLYVWVGAADLAVEKIRTNPVVEKVRERSRRLGEKSIIERARDIEPRLRERSDELQARGEKVVKRLRGEAEQVRKQIQTLPDDARKQLKELPSTARKQVDEVRGRIQKAVTRNGATTEKKSPAAAKAEPAKKTSAS